LIIALFNSKSKLTDEELILKYRSSENSFWLGELYQRYSMAIAGVCFNYMKNREEAEDAAMEIFEILTKDLKKYEIKIFRPWLLNVVRHHCLKNKDKNKRIYETKDTYKKEHHLFIEIREELGNSVEQDYEKVMDHLNRAIDSLNDEQKLCIELFYLRDLSYKEITDQTGMNESKVKSHIQNGKRNLKIFLEGQLNER
jgi:RNA polymerase sigma-70 factor (ECF subfamily)